MFCSCYDHQSEEEANIGRDFIPSVSIVYVFLVLIDLMSQILLLLDQIKPIEQLVPVS